MYHGLAKDSLLASVVDLATVGEHLGLTSAHIDNCSWARLHGTDLLIEELILHGSQHEGLTLEEVVSKRALFVFRRGLNPVTTVQELLRKLDEELCAHLDHIWVNAFEVLLVKSELARVDVANRELQDILV